MNRVTLYGNLGSDVELRDVGSTKVAKFSMATNKTWKDKEGNKQEKVTWHSCEAWGRTAEVMAGYLAKGSSIIVEGEIDNQTYEKEGEKRYASKVKVNDFYFTASKSETKTQPFQAAPASKDNSNMDIPF